jgi:hypothetical protein
MAFRTKIIAGLQEFINEMKEWAQRAFLPVGSIIMYHGNIANIPSNWKVCDGTNGTPDLRGRYPVGVTGSQSTGTKLRDGLPNIIGFVPGTEGYYYSSSTYKNPWDSRGAIRIFDWNTTVGNSDNTVVDNNTFVFDASKGTVASGSYTVGSGGTNKGTDNVVFTSQSASPYGKSTTVRPLSTVVYFIMKVR